MVYVPVSLPLALLSLFRDTVGAFVCSVVGWLGVDDAISKWLPVWVVLLALLPMRSTQFGLNGENTTANGMAQWKRDQYDSKMGDVIILGVVVSIMPSYKTMLLGEAPGSKSSSESKQATRLSMSVTVSCMIALLNRV